MAAGPKTYDIGEDELMAEAKKRGLNVSEFEPTARGPSEAPYATMTPGSDSRVRLDLGLGPSAQAQRNLSATEGWTDPQGNPTGKQGRNVYDQHPIATMLGGMEGGKLAEWTGIHPSWLGKKIGGQDYQDYDQAAKSFESAFMPVLSGAAVTPTEAQRMIRANLPEPGDSPKTLAVKASNRAMMINAASDLAGKPRPFPKIGTMNLRDQDQRSAFITASSAGHSAMAPAPAAPKTAPSIQPGQVYKGHRFRGGDPHNQANWDPA